MTENIELKIYKRLAEIRGNLLSSILERIHISSNNDAPHPEKQRILIIEISKPCDWVKNGFITSEEKAELELLKFLIEGEDDQCEIKRYRNHIEDYHHHHHSDIQRV
ncbi:MAG: hypothetical protein WDK96_03985 [Candidatus Paceibacterota bacterium]|jgi:hypothetical protein